MQNEKGMQGKREKQKTIEYTTVKVLSLALCEISFSLYPPFITLSFVRSFKTVQQLKSLDVSV